MSKRFMLAQEDDLLEIEYPISTGEQQREVVQVIRNFKGRFFINTFIGKFFLEDLKKYDIKILSVMTKAKFDYFKNIATEVVDIKSEEEKNQIYEKALFDIKELLSSIEYCRDCGCYGYFNKGENMYMPLDDGEVILGIINEALKECNNEEK